MKLSKYLVGTLACALMAGCADEENVGNGSTGQGEGQLSYVAVNIVNDNSAGSRADYEDGQDDEIVISEARFYLFDASGNPYNVITNEAENVVSGTNYVGFNTLENLTGETDPNVEAIKKGVLVFKGTNSDGELPASIVAVLNPPSILGNGSKSLSELQAAIDDYGSTPNFVMSNSVYYQYKDGRRQEIAATNIEGKVADNQSDAEKSPVDIYVERVLAKVRVKFTETDKAGQYKVSEEGEPAVYAKVLGWAVTNDNRKSNLLKDIDPNWKNGDAEVLPLYKGQGPLGTTPWSSDEYHRSYWAITPASINPVKDKSANEVINELKPTEPADATNINVARYCQENTLEGEDKRTEVIVIAQLVNEEGAPNPIYKYFGEEHDSERDILKLIANKYKNKYYNKHIDGYYVSLIVDDRIELVATSSEDAVKNEDYEVIPQLTETFIEEDLRKDIMERPNDTDGVFERDPVTGEYRKLSGTVEDIVEILNEELAKNPAQIAENGLVYYYTPIKHLGDAGSEGEYGVVRNHLYDVTISDIKGYGTPIFDPDKDIDTTHPKDEEVYINARINVLSWRVVSMDNVTLE